MLIVEDVGTSVGPFVPDVYDEETPVPGGIPDDPEGRTPGIDIVGVVLG